MKVYNKLVRDRIPEIIEKEGKKANFRVLEDDEECIQALKNKLVEEVNELLAAKTREEIKEELCDVKSVLWTLRSLYKFTPNETGDAYFKKEATKGSFTKRIFLESVEDLQDEEV